jgi:threonine dehydrogenase-like Zn-dependent dehydrogenase
VPDRRDRLGDRRLRGIHQRPLLERIQRGEIDPSFVITHRLRLEDAPSG